MYHTNRVQELTVVRPVGWAWRLCCGAIGLLAEAVQIPKDDPGGDITGVYNFRTRKFDNGTDPYGWYEEDM